MDGPRRLCFACHVVELAEDDKHDNCVRCLGVDHATSALVTADFCFKCADIGIRSLQERLTLARAEPATPGGEAAPLPPSGTALATAFLPRSLGRRKQALPTKRDKKAIPPSSPSSSGDDDEWPDPLAQGNLVWSDQPEDPDLAEENPTYRDVITPPFFSPRASSSVSTALPSSRFEPPKRSSKSEMFSQLFSRATDKVGVPWPSPSLPELDMFDDEDDPDWVAPTGRRPPPLCNAVRSQVNQVWATPIDRPMFGLAKQWATLAQDDEVSYTKMPSLEPAIAHRFATAGRKPALVAPNDQTAKLAETVYAVGGQSTAFANNLAIVQQYTLKLLKDYKESTGPPLETLLEEIKTVTNFSLLMAKGLTHSGATTMALAVHTQRHLWTSGSHSLPKSERSEIIRAPISSTGLFGPAFTDLADQVELRKREAEAARVLIPWAGPPPQAATRAPGSKAKSKSKRPRPVAQGQGQPGPRAPVQPQPGPPGPWPRAASAPPTSRARDPPTQPGPSGHQQGRGHQRGLPHYRGGGNRGRGSVGYQGRS